MFHRQLLPWHCPTDRSCLQLSTTLFSLARLCFCSVGFISLVCKSWLLVARKANAAMLGLQTGNLADSRGWHVFPRSRRNAEACAVPEPAGNVGRLAGLPSSRVNCWFCLSLAPAEAARGSRLQRAMGRQRFRCQSRRGARTAQSLRHAGNAPNWFCPCSADVQAGGHTEPRNLCSMQVWGICKSSKSL